MIFNYWHLLELDFQLQHKVQIEQTVISYPFKYHKVLMAWVLPFILLFIVKLISWQMYRTI